MENVRNCNNTSMQTMRRWSFGSHSLGKLHYQYYYYYHQKLYFYHQLNFLISTFIVNGGEYNKEMKVNEL